MKKLLIILGIVFVVLIVLCAGVLFLAQRAGSTQQDAFFAAVESGDVEQVLKLFDSALKEEVDQPVLAAWVKTVNNNLGAYQGLSATDFDTSTKYEGGVKLTESKGTVNFEKGTARSELRFHNDLLVAFSVTSDRIPDDWFQGPADTAIYRRRGEEFLKKLLGGEVEAAYAMMHENLRQQMPLDQLNTSIPEFLGKVGSLKAVNCQSDSYSSEGGQRLKVIYSLDCEKSPATAEVEFQFVGMKGHILGFDVQSSEG